MKSRRRAALSTAAFLAMLPGAYGAPGVVIATSEGGSVLDLNDGSVLVDELVTLAVTDDITSATVRIDAGLQPEDALSCDAPAAGLSCDYNGNGTLSVTGSGTSADWEATLRSVRLATASSVEDPRVISFTLGSAIPFRGADHTVDHYYEYIPPTCDGPDGCGVSWQAGKSLAEGRQLFGLQGYLATITSQAENDFIAQKLAGDGWIGSSDDYREINAVTGAGYADQAPAEGNWHWVTGPEAGTLFSTGDYAPEAAPGQFMNWTGGEPNNYPLFNEDALPDGEYYGQIYSSGGGQWNDLPLGTGYGLGYAVEYGGMAGDPVVELSANKTVTVLAADPDPATPQQAFGEAFDPLVLFGMALAALARNRRRHSL